MKAVMSAFGLGFLINMLPLGGLVGGVTGLAFAVARPVLLFFGVVKVCELFRDRYSAESRS